MIPVSIKIAFPTPCGSCGRVMSIGEWAVSRVVGEVVCSVCAGEEKEGE